MTTILGIDTATADTVAGVTCDGELVAEETAGPGEDRPRHATALLGAIERCAEAAGGWGAIDRIAVGTGPGTFTGLRIGIVTARSLAAAHDLPITPVSSLTALAAGGGRGRGVLALIDARRGEVFALLRGSDGSIAGPLAVPPSGLQEFAGGASGSICIGDGSVRFREEIEALGGFEIPPDEDALHRIQAREVCALGAESDPVELESVTPTYLREPDAKRWIERDRPDPAG